MERSTAHCIKPEGIDAYALEHGLDDVICQRLRQLTLSELALVTLCDLSAARNASAMLFMRCNRYEKSRPTPILKERVDTTTCEACDPDEADASPNRSRSEKRRANRANKLGRLDGLLDAILSPSPAGDDDVTASLPRWLLDMEWPLQSTSAPTSGRLDWSGMGATCDPFRVAPRLANTPCGQRKRESVEAFAWLLERMILPRWRSCHSMSKTQASGGVAYPTIVDAGCSTGSLLLPLAHAFPEAHFIGIDLKPNSLALLRERARAAGLSERRVSTWEGRIEDYDGPLDALVSLHACGGASDAALQLATRRAPPGARAAPFAVSPCCVGAIAVAPHHLGNGLKGTSARGAASAWLRAHLLRAGAAATADAESGAPSEVQTGEIDGHEAEAESRSTERLFALLAASADASAPLGLEDGASAAARQRRAKRVIELDRLAAMPGEGLGGHLLRISGEAMAATSILTDVLVGPPEALVGL